MENLKAPCAPLIFYRSYSRIIENRRENFYDTLHRCIEGLSILGKLNSEEKLLLLRLFKELKCLPSGRWLWIGGSKWIENPKNFSGAYNCTSLIFDSPKIFGYLMDLSMQGCGTGSIIEKHFIENIPKIKNKINLSISNKIGTLPKNLRRENTEIIEKDLGKFYIQLGDSREGWIQGYQGLIDLSMKADYPINNIDIELDLGSIRSKGEKLKSFGGIANPEGLENLFYRIADILNANINKKLNSLQICLLIDEASKCVVSGNIRRSAGIHQGSADDEIFINAKANLWQKIGDKWRIDPERDSLRMANHTIVFHKKPSYEEILKSIESQYYSGEGAIQWAGEAIARANIDLIKDKKDKKEFLKIYEEDRDKAKDFLRNKYFSIYNEEISEKELHHRILRYGLNPCGEIIGTNFHCNLSEIHLNNLDPKNFDEQEEAFRAGTLAAASLLHHKFINPLYQESREFDPIVGVSITGLFDFFVKTFGIDWIIWWQEGRPTNDLGKKFKNLESIYLRKWKSVVANELRKYCDRHNLKMPNRFTTIQPAGSKSLLSNASPGWHPPKSLYYIRRITFAKNDPIALAAKDFGYKIIPSLADKDDQGNLLNDPFDERITEWLIEVPIKVSWADQIPEYLNIDPNKFSAKAQFDFYMQVQKFYTTHNTSATIELRKDEITELADCIYQSIQNDEGYISIALMPRMDDFQNFPRLPIEPISKEYYLELMQEVEKRRISENFYELLKKYSESPEFLRGPNPCDSFKCSSAEKFL